MFELVFDKYPISKTLRPEGLALILQAENQDRLRNQTNKSRFAGVWKAFLGVLWATCCRQLDSRLRNLVAKSVKKHRRGYLGVMLRVSWPIWKTFWEYFAQKNWQATYFKNFQLNFFFDSSVVQVGVLGAMLADVGFKLGVFGSSWGDLGACWRQDGRQERQDGDQERQDEPR